MGTLQLFYGSNISMDEPLFADDKTLRNEDVLRRQIEEYMKFRAPVLLVKELIDKIVDNKLKEDTGIIEDKMALESEMAEMYEKYKELYNAIVLADRCTQAIHGIAGGHFGSVSTSLTAIRRQFAELRECYAYWESMVFYLDFLNSEDPPDHFAIASVRAAIADSQAHYQSILGNISSLTAGGPRGSVWSGGRWQSTLPVLGLNVNIANAKIQADNFKPNFDAVVTIAREIDAKNAELRRKVDDLERRINNGDCSDELREALMERQGIPPMSLIERYRDILKWHDITGMSTVFRNGGYNYIDNIHKPMLDGVRYRNVNSPGSRSLSREELAGIASNPGFRLSMHISADSSNAAFFAGFSDDSVTYKMAPGFLKFAEHPGDNRAFFQALSAMMNQPALAPVKLYDDQEEAGGKNAEEKQEGQISALLNLVETAYIGLTNNPLGAAHINDSGTPAREKLGILEIATMIPQAIRDPVINVISDPLGSMAGVGDYLLLLTYGTSAFSNYTTTRPESIGKTKDGLDEIDFPKSITGVPIRPKVNYFFQSEWEYLYSGHENAGKNLDAVTRLIFLVRLVCNYISVFGIKEVTAVVTKIQVAFAWNPPLALFLGELARAAFTAAETLVDVAALRTGHKVPLFKRPLANEWVCTPSGVKKAVSNIIASESVDNNRYKDDGGGAGEGKKERGLTYSSYMLYFFITKAIFYVGTEPDAATELAKRTGNLIEWNMVNYQNDINADEEKMAAALEEHDRFRLVDMKTDFHLTTTVNMRMLFLSMLFAQNFSDGRGIGMPTTMPVTVTYYRGY
jgi:hypothetical protein